MALRVTEGVTQQWVNGNFVRKIGDTMTGSLIFNTTDTAIIIDTIRDFWPFRFANGIGIDNTGLFFDATTNGAYEFKILNSPYSEEEFKRLEDFIEYLKKRDPYEENLKSIVNNIVDKLEARLS